MAYTTVELPSIHSLKHWLLRIYGDDSHFVLLDSNVGENFEGEFDWIAAGECLHEIAPTEDIFRQLRESRKAHPGWWFGRMNYDLKNHVEKLSSENSALFNWTDVRFFLAGWVLTSKKGVLHLHLHSDYGDEEKWRNAGNLDSSKSLASPSVTLEPQMSRSTYLEKANSLLAHIHRGDIYEVNFCQQFIAEQVDLNPVAVYLDLVEAASPPMGAFWHAENEWAISMSPERYLRKSGQRLISQPIKGTAKRSKDEQEDRVLADDLFNSQKERAENVMIVDLVRNDLSRVAERSSVEVTELFGIHSFKTVHQMISTVEANLKPEHDIWDAIQASFPMGSMTGAPKVSAMKLIEEHEIHKRELYSGSIGYITPEDDFDFSVVIRTILYDSENRSASVSVGSALTAEANPESEWEECLIKLDALKKVLARGSRDPRVD